MMILDGPVHRESTGEPLVGPFGHPFAAQKSEPVEHSHMHGTPHLVSYPGAHLTLTLPPTLTLRAHLVCYPVVHPAHESILVEQQRLDDTIKNHCHNACHLAQGRGWDWSGEWVSQDPNLGP